MKDFILTIALVTTGINLITTSPVSDFHKCLSMFLFVVADALWICYSSQGQKLIKDLSE